MNRLAFSAASLQDYQDCPLRFELRYIRQLRWPAREGTEAMETGNQVHRMVQQALLGFPRDLLPAVIADFETVDVLQLIDRLTSELGDAKRFVEHSVSLRFNDVDYTGKFDLLYILPDNNALIFDWKTDLHFRPESFDDRVQTRLYLWMAQRLYGCPVATLKVVSLRDGRMRTIQADMAKISTYEREIDALVREITAIEPGAFQQTTDVVRCRYCTYKHYCRR